MEWYETMMKYGFKSDETEAHLLNDPDIRLVPTLMEKIILPKISGITKTAELIVFELTQLYPYSYSFL